MKRSSSRAAMARAAVYGIGCALAIEFLGGLVPATWLWIAGLGVGYCLSAWRARGRGRGSGRGGEQDGGDRRQGAGGSLGIFEAPLVLCISVGLASAFAGLSGGAIWFGVPSVVLAFAVCISSALAYSRAGRNGSSAPARLREVATGAASLGLMLWLATSPLYREGLSVWGFFLAQILASPRDPDSDPFASLGGGRPDPFVQAARALDRLLAKS